MKYSHKLKRMMPNTRVALSVPVRVLILNGKLS